jgi:isopenicillin N synthase-like dioxygenase
MDWQIPWLFRTEDHMKNFILSTLLIFSSALFPQDALDLRIPVVDMQDYQDETKRDEFLDTLYRAMKEVGFFAVRNTGVDVSVVQKAYADAEEFFRLDLETKLACYNPELNGQRGFVPGEFAKGNQNKDQKEFYHVGREGSSPANIWPENLGFKDSLGHLYKELERYVGPLQRAIIETINRNAGTSLPLDLLNEMINGGDTILRALYYPKISQEQMGKAPTFWAAAHTDIDLLAILPYGTEKGLQVELGEQWLNVVVPSDAFVVNVGDMLENLTNGLFTSAKHRVLAQEPGKDRFSMVLFVHPRDEASLDPLPVCIELTGGVQTYAPGTRQEFLWERLLELDIAPMLLETYAKTGHTERQLLFGKQSPQVVQMLIDRGLASEELLEKVRKQCL